MGFGGQGSGLPALPPVTKVIFTIIQSFLTACDSALPWLNAPVSHQPESSEKLFRCHLSGSFWFFRSDSYIKLQDQKAKFLVLLSSRTQSFIHSADIFCLTSVKTSEFGKDCLSSPSSFLTDWLYDLGELISPQSITSVPPLFKDDNRSPHPKGLSWGSDELLDMSA